MGEPAPRRRRTLAAWRAREELASRADLGFIATGRVVVEHAVPGGDGSRRSVFHTDLGQTIRLDGLGLALPLAAI